MKNKWRCLENWKRRLTVTSNSGTLHSSAIPSMWLCRHKRCTNFTTSWRASTLSTSWKLTIYKRKPICAFSSFEILIWFVHWSLLDAETNAIRPRSFGWTAYNNYTEIYDWLDVLLATYPTILSSHIVGYTYQERPIRAVKLSHKQVRDATLKEKCHTTVNISLDSSNGIICFVWCILLGWKTAISEISFLTKGNPTIFIESNIHAREWITSATATWFLNELLTSTDPEMQDLAQNIDWYIIPVFNVDGFHYTHTTVNAVCQTILPILKFVSMIHRIDYGAKLVRIMRPFVSELMPIEILIFNGWVSDRICHTPNLIRGNLLKMM